LRQIKTVTLLILQGVFTLPWLVFELVTADSTDWEAGQLCVLFLSFLLSSPRARNPVRTEKAGARRAS
jgi:hypothetical protein